MENKKNNPDSVGILAIEVYFPYLYVDQHELEKFDCVSTGKYTKGLGQLKMGFCNDREDINSLALTVTQKLMQRNSIKYSDIGRLDVGTETIIDKSKSIKSVLMQLFEKSNNYDVEGVDSTNACYGGTAALFNAINWIESSYWDGRYALVVMADIAVYATGNARQTGGAGAVAMLIGPNSPLTFDKGLRSTYMQHTYDFFKPNLSSEYPIVDGKLSIECYLKALDNCYQTFKKKRKKLTGDNSFSLHDVSTFIFHTPFCKMVQKAMARLLLVDYLMDSSSSALESLNGISQFGNLKLEDTYFNKELERFLVERSNSFFVKHCEPALLLAQNVGNMYTPSLYGGLVSYLSQHSLDELQGQLIVLFSYGSGLASSMFSLRVSHETHLREKLQNILTSLADLKERLNSRLKISPSEFTEIMKLREETHGLAPYTPKCSVEDLFPDTWYLENIDKMHRRTYKVKPHSTAQQNIFSLQEDSKEKF